MSLPESQYYDNVCCNNINFNVMPESQYVNLIQIFKPITAQINSELLCDWLKYMHKVGNSVLLTFQQTLIQKYNRA